jgi:NTP pyrophosphatase (non-canonical NTP hydrolase)
LRREAGLENRKYRDYLRGRSLWNFNERGAKMPRDGKSFQEQVYDLVAQRGYRAQWTTREFIARQVAKLAEELGEAARVVELPGRLGNLITATGIIAGYTFDQQGEWYELTNVDVDALQTELADIQVVVFCLAQALTELAGDDYNVVRAALAKATTDVLRGKRT